MPTITVYADYVCPYCLLAGQVLSKAIGDRDIAISWRAFELRPAPVPTLRPEDRYLPAVWSTSVYPLAERLGVSLRLPSISPQPRTARAFELLAMAQDKGLDHAYSMRVLRAFFQENRDIGAPEILIGLAEDAGLDRNEASRALRCRTHAERHRKALRHAREDKAITSVPTVVVGNRVFLGTPRPDELRLAIDQLDGGGDSPLDQTDSHAARHRPSNTTGNERKTP